MRRDEKPLTRARRLFDRARILSNFAMALQFSLSDPRAARRQRPGAVTTPSALKIAVMCDLVVFSDSSSAC